MRATSLNRGEVRNLDRRPDGEVPGWDVAGIVLKAAADGSGPQRGARVVGLVGGGAWAQLAAVSTDRLAELPDGISLEDASALPIAGLTALHLLTVAGELDGKGVLVTGAAGGVGRLVIQLAKRAGAHVTGVVRDESRGEGLHELGADELITELLPGGEDYDVILESVGGASLGASLNRVAPGGIVISFGNSIPQPASFDVSDFYHRPKARLYAFQIFEEVGSTGSQDLRRLADQVAAGELDPGVSLTASWREAYGALEALMDRRVNGKAVLRID